MIPMYQYMALFTAITVISSGLARQSAIYDTFYRYNGKFAVYDGIEPPSPHRLGAC